MLLVKGQRSRGGQPTQGTTRGAPSGYIKAEVVRLLLVRKLFRPLSQSRPEVRWCNRVTYFKALFIKEHEAAWKPCGKYVAVMDAGGPCPCDLGDLGRLAARSLHFAVLW